MTDLKILAEAVEGWGNCTEAWLDTSEDDAAAVVGHIDEDGNTYPVAVIDCEQYYAGHDSLKLAKFYAAANPTVVLRLLNEGDSMRQQLSSHDAEIERLEKVSVFKEECRQSIEQQLASRDAEVAEYMLERTIRKATEQSNSKLIAERDQLSEQVTLLREVMNRIAFSRVGTCENIALELFNREAWAIEALAATEPRSTK